MSLAQLPGLLILRKVMPSGPVRPAACGFAYSPQPRCISLLHCRVGRVLRGPPPLVCVPTIMFGGPRRTRPTLRLAACVKARTLRAGHPLPPDAAEHGGKVLGEPLGVAQRRLRHSRRSPERISANRGRSRPSRTAISTYSSRSRAMVSVSPIVDRWANDCRPAKVSPGQVTTGTPIHSASQVERPPVCGNGSSVRSTSL